ncbi:hypothetical protein MLD38_034045 [Melastoma candidum]|uniref:Uncharacterized protein n=1 Tax=Melastoma candidum TaxID=119954 RepID=A0ACB9MA24_9MYRT|nr:hypothetical protein MLD38_034045 [Melastoma candidum]
MRCWNLSANLSDLVEADEVEEGPSKLKSIHSCRIATGSIRLEITCPCWLHCRRYIGRVYDFAIYLRSVSL